MALPKLNGTPRTLSHSPAPSPCGLQSGGVGRLARSGWRLYPIGGLAVGLLAGCGASPTGVSGSLTGPPLAPTTQRSPSTPRQVAMAPAWNAVFQKWWQAATKPQPHAASSANQPPHPVVFINVAVIAAHHPAWRLADALERGGAGAETLAALQAPASVTGLQGLAAPMPFGPLTVGVPGGVPGYNRAAKTVTVRDLDELQTVAYQRQAEAINDFLTDAAAAQAQSRAAQAATLKSALAEDIETARRLNLAALTPTLPSDPIQLEMTNLRLALLKNLYATPQEKEQTRQRLDDLEAQWEAKLRSQETQRLAELTRLRQERPQRLRQTGETRINETLSAAAQQDATARATILRAHNTLLAEDFTPDTTRLGLVLPAAALPAQRLAGIVSPPRQRGTTSKIKLSETFHVKITSANIHERSTIKNWSSVPKSDPALSGRIMSQAATIQALRAQAWQDARRWAGIVARRAGWSWQGTAAGQQTHQSAPDRTREALRILNLS